MNINNTNKCKECKKLERESEGQVKVTHCETKNGKHHSSHDQPALCLLLSPGEDNESKIELWFNKGGIHRNNNPAIISCNGDYQWYHNGVPHRKNNEQAIDWCGFQAWAEDGLAHRTNGPALIEVNGTKHWCIRGEEMTEDEFNKRKK